MTVDLLPERRVATIENAWTPDDNVHPGDEIPVKVFLRPYRGERIERDFTLKLPPGISKGEHRILLSDADTANRTQTLAASTNRYMDVPQLVSLLNQERSNNKLYVRSSTSNPTAYYEDKTLPSLPSSVLNVMQAGRTTTQTDADLARKRERTDVAAVRLCRQRKLYSARHREVSTNEELSK